MLVLERRFCYIPHDSFSEEFSYIHRASFIRSFSYTPDSIFSEEFLLLISC